MTCRANAASLRTSMVRALSFSAALALTLTPALTPVVAADYRPAPQHAVTLGITVVFSSIPFDRRSSWNCSRLT